MKWSIRSFWNPEIKNGLVAGLYIAIIIGAIKVLISAAKKIPDVEGWKRVWSFVVENSMIPNWLILIVLILLLVYLFKFCKSIFVRLNLRRKRLVKEGKDVAIFTKVSKDLSNIPKIAFSQKVFNPIKTPISINPSFLERQNGTFYIWALVTEVQRAMKKALQNVYLVSYATNNGISLHSEGGRYYPNAWAIMLQYPNPQNNNGFWRFWTNGPDPIIINIDKNEFLEPGWQLFTVSWSRVKNTIQFYNNDNLIGTSTFRAWPSDLRGSCIIGSWVNRKPFHNYTELIGPCGFFETDDPLPIISEQLSIPPK